MGLKDKNLVYDMDLNRKRAALAYSLVKLYHLAKSGTVYTKFPPKNSRLWSTLTPEDMKRLYKACLAAYANKYSNLSPNEIGLILLEELDAQIKEYATVPRFANNNSNNLKSKFNRSKLTNELGFLTSAYGIAHQNYAEPFTQNNAARLGGVSGLMYYANNQRNNKAHVDNLYNKEMQLLSRRLVARLIAGLPKSSSSQQKNAPAGGAGSSRPLANLGAPRATPRGKMPANLPAQLPRPPRNSNNLIA